MASFMAFWTSTWASSKTLDEFLLQSCLTGCISKVQSSKWDLLSTSNLWHAIAIMHSSSVSLKFSTSHAFLSCCSIYTSIFSLLHNAYFMLPIIFYLSSTNYTFFVLIVFQFYQSLMLQSECATWKFLNIFLGKCPSETAHEAIAFNTTS